MEMPPDEVKKKELKLESDTSLQVSIGNPLHMGDANTLLFNLLALLYTVLVAH